MATEQTPPKGRPTPTQKGRVNITPNGQPPQEQRPPFSLPEIPDEQKQKIVQVFQGLLEKFTAHKPVLKALKDIGVKYTVQEIDGVQSIIIPVRDLMEKEYLAMSGLSMGEFK